MSVQNAKGLGGSNLKEKAVRSAGALDLALAFRLAFRELRVGKRGFSVFVGCIFLGVFAIAAVGSVSEASRSALMRDARSLLGGDAVVRLASNGLTPLQESWLSEQGEMAQTITLRAMLRVTQKETPKIDGVVAQTGRILVEVKGVSDTWPLYGAARFSGDIPRERVFRIRQGLPSIAVEESLFVRLGIRVGDTVKIGQQEFYVAAGIAEEPDRVMQGLTLGPRVLMAEEALSETGLLLPGSLMRRNVHLRFYSDLQNKTGRFDSEMVKAFVTSAQASFPDAGWQIRRFDEVAPRIRRLLDRLDIDLMLIGLGALLIGGIGVAEAVRGFLDSRLVNIAAMKCVGGSNATVLATYFLQVVCMGGVAIALACIAGALVPLAVADLLAGFLPVAIERAVYWDALLRAAVFGLAVIIAFSLPGLLRAVSVSPTVLFRGYVGEAPQENSIRAKFAIGVAYLLLAAITVFFTDSLKLSAGFIAGTVACFWVFKFVAYGIRYGARKASRYGGPAVRLGMAALHRPGAPTIHLTFALGLGLTALVGIAQLEHTLTGALQRDLSRDAPAYFFINILPEQRTEFREIVEREGVRRVDSSPMVRGRIVRIAGIPVGQAKVASDVQWAVRGDRGISHAVRMPEGTEVVSGTWWPEDYSGPPIISLTEDLAKGFGVGVGDSLAISILGREITATIANIRQVDWMTFQLQFAIVFAPGVLDAAPVTWVSTVYANDLDADIVYKEVTEQLPNVTALGMREILSNVQSIMHRIGFVFRGMALVMLATGCFVLAGAVLADRRRRMYDTVVYKVCGATTSDVLRALMTEFAVVGGATGVFAAITGTIAAWGAAGGIMKLAFAPDMQTIALTVFAGGSFALLFGVGGTIQALRKKPAPYLRNE